MNAIIAIEELIQTNEKRIRTLKAQLNDHESGRIKLSVLAHASAEKPWKTLKQRWKRIN